MEEELQIILKAVDDASSTFESVTQSANEMGSSFTESAAEGTEGFEDIEDSAQGATDTITEVVNSCNDMDGSGLREAANGADELENEALEADNAVRDLSDDLSIINSSMLLQTAEQLGAIGDKAEGMAQDMNTAAISVGQLATQTGIAEPEMVNLINTISNATFPNDEAMMYVKALNQMGVESSNFGKSATDMDKINDAFGLGAQTVTGLSNELSVLGVDMNDVSSAFNALAYANANTVGGMDNFYSFVKKYDADFKELGFDVDQTAVIIAQATHKFGAGKAAYKGLSDALKEADGDARKLEEALGMQPGTLSKASEMTGEYEGQLQALADEEAEHKTWLDQLGAAWEDFSLSMSPVLEPLGAAVGLIGEVGSFGLQVKGLQELSGALRGTATWIRDFNMAKTIQNALEGEGAIASLAGALGITTEAAAAEGASVAFGGLAVAEGAALWPILAIVAAIALLVVAVFEIGKAFGWWNDIGSMISAIESGIMRLWNAFINHPDVQSVLQVINDALSWIWDNIVGVGQALLEFFGLATDGDFDIVRALIDGIGAAWDAIKEPIMAVINIISMVLTVVWDVVNGNTDAVTALTAIWNSLVANMPVILNALFGVFLSIFTSIYNTVSRMIRNTVNNVVSYLSQLPGRALTQLLRVVNSIISAGQQWVSNAQSKASEVVNGAYTILSSLPGKITSALGGVVDAIVAPFKKAYNDAKQVWDDIVSLASNIPGIAMGGETAPAYAGETLDLLSGNTFNTQNGAYTIKEEKTLNLNLNLENVPAHIDTNTLINMLTSKEVIDNFVGSNQFQTKDLEVKTSINSRNRRARGA